MGRVLSAVPDFPSAPSILKRSSRLYSRELPAPKSGTVRKLSPGRFRATSVPDPMEPVRNPKTYRSTPAVTGAFVVSAANEKCVRVYGLVRFWHLKQPLVVAVNKDKKALFLPVFF